MQQERERKREWVKENTVRINEAKMQFCYIKYAEICFVHVCRDLD